MQYGYDTAGRYFPPPQHVTLASLGVPPYSPPTHDSDREDRVAVGAIPWAAPDVEAQSAGIPFADMARAISPAADSAAWREDNRALFWVPDDLRAPSAPSFDDFVRPVDPSANPDAWNGTDDVPRYAGWRGMDGYAAPDNSRAAALGAFHVPGAPEDAAGWGLRGEAPVGADDLLPVLLASRWGRNILSDIWKAFGGVPGGRHPEGPPATAPTGRRKFPLGSHNAPPRNTPGEVHDRPYSGHGFDKVQDQGLMPSVIEEARKHGNWRAGNKPGTSRYYDAKNDVSVVVDDKTGRVITNHYGDRDH